MRRLLSLNIFFLILFMSCTKATKYDYDKIITYLDSSNTKYSGFNFSIRGGGMGFSLVQDSSILFKSVLFDSKNKIYSLRQQLDEKDFVFLKNYFPNDSNQMRSIVSAKSYIDTKIHTLLSANNSEGIRWLSFIRDSCIDIQAQLDDKKTFLIRTNSSNTKCLELQKGKVILFKQDKWVVFKQE